MTSDVWEPQPTGNRRVGLSGARHSPETRAKMSAAHRNPPVIGVCVWCGQPATEYDHPVPVKLGGDPAHRVPSCRACNGSKGMRTPDAWLEAGLRGAGPVDRRGYPVRRTGGNALSIKAGRSTPELDSDQPRSAPLILAIGSEARR